MKKTGKRDVYPEEYKKYLQYCKEHGYSPYRLLTLQKMSYQIEGSWKLTPREKVDLWYEHKLFKVRENNSFYKWKKEKEYYDNYEGDKVVFWHFINMLREGLPKEKAIIKKDRKTDLTKWYEDNINKAEVSLNRFRVRVNSGWEKEIALTTPSIKPSQRRTKRLEK